MALLFPRVCVIIVTHNGRQFLSDCLSSLARVDYPSEQWSVVVVDNASGDGSVAYVRQMFPSAQVMGLRHNAGFAAANNVGLREAISRGCDFAFLLNQDTVVTPGFLREAVAVAETDPTIAAVQSKLLLHGTSLVNSWGNEIHFLGFGFAGGHRQPDQALSVREITYASGAAVLLRCAALQRVGCFMEEFYMYHEDLELGWRLWLSGYRSMLAPQSVAYHKYEFSRSAGKFYWMERNRFLVLYALYRWRTLALISPLIVAVDAGLLLESFFRGFWRQAFAAHGYFFTPAAWRQVRQLRRRVQKLRQVPDRAIVKRFASRIKFQDLPESWALKLGNWFTSRYWRVVLPLIRW